MQPNTPPNEPPKKSTLRKNIATTALFLLASGFLGAPIQNAYAQGGGPAAGKVLALAITRATPTTLYAGTADGGVFKSTNSGNSWVAANSGIPNLANTVIWALAIDPATPATLYAGTYGSGVLKSSDGGTSWVVANSGLPGDVAEKSVFSLAIDPATPTTLYAGTSGGGVFKSTNGGASWNAANLGIPDTRVTVLAIDPATPATLYAGTSDGIFKSANKGTSWTAVSSGGVKALIIDPSTPARIYAAADNGDGISRSTNGGVSWSGANSGLPSIMFQSLAIDPASPSTLYVGSSDGIFKSTNRGTSWVAANSGITTKGVRALIIDPSTPATLYAGTDEGGVFKSTNAGKTWKPTGATSGTAGIADLKTLYSVRIEDRNVAYEFLVNDIPVVSQKEAMSGIISKFLINPQLINGKNTFKIRILPVKNSTVDPNDPKSCKVVISGPKEKGESDTIIAQAEVNPANPSKEVSFTVKLGYPTPVWAQAEKIGMDAVTQRKILDKFKEFHRLIEKKDIDGIVKFSAAKFKEYAKSTYNPNFESNVRDSFKEEFANPSNKLIGIDVQEKNGLRYGYYYGGRLVSINNDEDSSIIQYYDGNEGVTTEYPLFFYFDGKDFVLIL